MSRYRLARPAQVDLIAILRASAERWGAEGRRRYAALLAAAMRKAAADPEGPLTRRRTDLHPELRSLHIRYARREAPDQKVRHPVHVLYYRIVAPDVVEIVRVLHERMEPSEHLPE